MQNDKRIKVGGIMESRELCLVGVMSAPDRPGIVSAIFGALGEAHLNAGFIVQSVDLNNESHIQFCVAHEDQQRVFELLSPTADQVGAAKLDCRCPVSILSVFGPDFRERPGIAGTVFGACASAGVNILAVSTSISTISIVIDDRDHDQVRAALEDVLSMP